MLLQKSCFRLLLYNIDISQGSAATHLGFVGSLELVLLQFSSDSDNEKTVWELVNIWQSYKVYKNGPHCIQSTPQNFCLTTIYMYVKADSRIWKKRQRSCTAVPSVKLSTHRTCAFRISQRLLAFSHVFRWYLKIFFLACYSYFCSIVARQGRCALQVY